MSNVEQFLQDAARTLRTAGIDSPRLDVLILLEDELQKDRSHLLAHPEIVLSTAQLAKLSTFITQRKKHIPLAYIRGRAPFFGRMFRVNEYTLVPRPETESIIELLQKIDFKQPPVMVDVGSGSGCIGITAALELPGSTIHFYDINKTTLQTTEANAAQYDVSGAYYITNVLDAWYADYTVVLANLPYVPKDYPINRAAGFEPDTALFSGNDGLDHYRLLWQQIASRTTPLRPQHVVTESLPEQHTTLAMFAKLAGYRLCTTEGYAQHFTLVES